MKKLDEPLTRLQLLISVIIGTLAIAGATATGVGKLHTDAEAEKHVKDFQKYQLEQRKERRAERIEIFELELDDIDFRLLDESLSERQREYLKNQRKDIERTIECLRQGEC